MLLAAAGLFAAGCCQLYSTHFEGADSCSRKEKCGSITALIGQDQEKNRGIACANQTGTDTGIYQFDDSYAHLTGFPPDQEAWAKRRSPDPTPRAIRNSRYSCAGPVRHRTTGI